MVISVSINDGLTISEIQKLAHKRGWTTIHLASTAGEIPQNIVPRCALIQNASMQDPIYRQLKNIGCCVVNLNSLPHEPDRAQPVIQDDFQSEGRLAAEHFAERGFTAVGFPVYLPDSPLLRFESFRTLASELGCSCHPLTFTKTKMEEGETIEDLQRRRYVSQLEKFKEWIQCIPRPIGLACPTDAAAARYAFMATQCGLSVPQDIAILGRGNIPYICECAPVNISSIVINEEERIATAFQLLDDMLAGKAPPAEPILISSKEVQVRASTDVQAASNPNVAEALKFIWNHYNDMNISVDDIAEAAGSSRRKLEYLFRSDLNETINAVIRKRRIEICKHLLITTDLTVADLCQNAGFRSKKHLHRVFKQANGMTPRQYRISGRSSHIHQDA